MRRRTVLCVALVVLVVAVTLAFVTAQDEEAPNAVEVVPEQPQDDVAVEAAPAISEEPIAATPETEEAAAPVEQHQQVEVQVQEDAAVVEHQGQQQEVQEVDAQAQAEAEAAALAAQEEARRLQQEEERLRLEAEENARRAAEEERMRLEEEARRRQAEEEERRRLQEEEAERQRRAEEEARQRREAEERRRREEEEAAEAAARRAAEEKRKRELDTVDQIRYAATELQDGCAGGVENYLFRVHEQRQPAAQHVSDLRSQLNEARVNAPSKVAKLEKELAHAQDLLLQYDVMTLRMYGGNVPKTCIAEAQAWFDKQADVVSENTYVQAYTHFYRLLAAHVHTMYHTAEGLVNYLIHSYTPAFSAFTASASVYQEKAWALYEELFPSKGSRPEMPLPELVKQVAIMAGYAAVPIGLGIAAGVVSVIALPPIAAGVLVYEYLYKIWAELFVFYYIYGMKLPEGAVAVVKSTVENVKAGQWNVLGNRVADGFFDLVVDSDRLFYNGIIALFLLFHVVVIAAILVCVWCRCCVPGMRSRKAKKNPLSASKNNNNKSKGSKKNSVSPPPKKASPAPASAEKKKN